MRHGRLEIVDHQRLGDAAEVGDPVVPGMLAEGTRASKRRYRASDQGFLPLRLDDYLKLLDWTGGRHAPGKAGAIPAALAPILERLRIQPAAHWCETVAQFGRWFRHAAGKPASLRRFAERRGQHWLYGMHRSRLAFDG